MTREAYIELFVLLQTANPARFLDISQEDSRMEMRIYVDFNTTTSDAKARVTIPLQMHPALAQALCPGMVVTLYDEEMEVQATVACDAHDQIWLGQPHWATRRDLPSLYRQDA